jgi:hypothetical protein
MENRKLLDISLNVDKLREQKKHFVAGKKGTYLDLRMIELENKQYNDFMVVVKVSKEDFDKGIKGDIVGYGKDWANHKNDSAPAQEKKLEANDLPF